MPRPTAIGFFVLAYLGGMMNAAEKPPMLKITTKRDTDKVDVKAENGKTVLSIESPFGISQAVIERTDETWPDGMVLRLHVKGLESFRVSNGKVTINAAMSGQDNVRQWKDANEDSLLDAGSPYRMEIRMVGSDGKSARGVPLRDGYFEILLPKAFFEVNPKSVTVNWIDFYRS